VTVQVTAPASLPPDQFGFMRTTATVSRPATRRRVVEYGAHIPTLVDQLNAGVFES
jgi:hypothetical protein